MLLYPAYLQLNQKRQPILNWQHKWHDYIGETLGRHTRNGFMMLTNIEHRN